MKVPVIAAPVIVTAIVCFSMAPASAADWLTRPSTYTHSAETGQRVSQYEPIALPQGIAGPPIRSSGYTNFRSSIAFGQSADNYHRVEKWGDPVRPYGEWRFPNRPYSAPYANWGPPFAGFGANIQSNFNAFGGAGSFGGQGFGGQGFGGQGFGGQGFGGQGFGGQGFGGQGFGGQPNVGTAPYVPGVPPGGYFGRPAVPGRPDLGASPLYRSGNGQAFPNPYPLTPTNPSVVNPYADGYHPVYRD